MDDQQVWGKVLAEYAIQLANQKIVIERQKGEIKRLEKEVSECSKNSEPKI